MRKPVHIRHDADEINHLVAGICTNLRAALDALKDAQPGFPTTSGGASLGGGSLNDAGKPNGLDKFVIHLDPASQALDELGTKMLEARESMRKVSVIVHLWSRDGGGAPTSELAQCVACERHVFGGDDRLRAGFCPACHSSWQRWKKTNTGYRHDWLMARRASIAELEARAEAS